MEGRQESPMSTYPNLFDCGGLEEKGGGRGRVSCLGFGQRNFCGRLLTGGGWVAGLDWDCGRGARTTLQLSGP